MVFEFKTDKDAGLLASFAQFTASTVKNGLLILPESFGKGYINGFNLSPLLKMMVHHYELNDDLVFRRVATKREKDTIILTFHNAFRFSGEVQRNGPVSDRLINRLPSVQVTSTDIDFETFFPANTTISTIIISVQVNLLSDLINPRQDNTLLQSIITGDQPYLYEEFSSPRIQAVAATIVEADVPDPLHDFYYKLKAEELIYLFLSELLKRQDTANNPLRPADVKKIYAVRDKLIADLSVAPNLPRLAHFSGLSESRLKRLFKQIFGNSIYNYYQTLRMHEAAYLLKEVKLSVSETGYRLGFSNLSHFTRLFERHIGDKPKRYSTSR